MAALSEAKLTSRAVPGTAVLRGSYDGALAYKPRSVEQQTSCLRRRTLRVTHTAHVPLHCDCMPQNGAKRCKASQMPPQRAAPWSSTAQMSLRLYRAETTDPHGLRVVTISREACAACWCRLWRGYPVSLGHINRQHMCANVSCRRFPETSFSLQNLCCCMHSCTPGKEILVMSEALESHNVSLTQRKQVTRRQPLELHSPGPVKTKNALSGNIREPQARPKPVRS